MELIDGGGLEAPRTPTISLVDAKVNVLADLMTNARLISGIHCSVDMLLTEPALLPFLELQYERLCRYSNKRQLQAANARSNAVAARISSAGLDKPFTHMYFTTST